MDQDVEIISLRERKDLAQAAIQYAEENWKFISPYYTEAVRQSLESQEIFPLTYILYKRERIIGFFTLQEHDVVKNQELTPWITVIFVDPAERGHNLVKDILLYGRRKAKEFGYGKLHLCTNHTQLYEKYGFKEIGLDQFVWGRPAKLYEISTTIEKPGKIVFLNGVSSSGKTTLALALQKRMKDPCFLIAQDIFRQMWGQKYDQDSPDNRYNQTMSLMYQTIRLFSEKQMNVVVDTLVFTDEFLDSYNGEGTWKDVVSTLKHQPVLSVHVMCELNTLREREQKRGDRKIGNAESQLPYLWPQDGYDLTIDTSSMTTEEAVELILNALNTME